MPRKIVAFFNIYVLWGCFYLKNRYIKHKTHIIYSMKFKSKKIMIMIMLLIFNICFLFTFKHIERNFQPTVEALAVSQANTYAIHIIDKSIEENPEIHTNYSDICKINKNENGEITSVTTDSSKINGIKLNLSKEIVKNINNNNLNLGIPIGNLTKTYIFSGRGPKIPIKILTTSSPSIYLESNFESAGVNQTKHKISIITNINLKIVLPYETLSKTVSYETLLFETIIVGKVPNVYVSK